jgi:hypothetical protein
MNDNPKLIDRELDALLHPARAFKHPNDVASETSLTLNEKRAILASWASDACAVDDAPVLGQAPGSEQIVSVDEILEALRALDKQADETGPSWARRQVRRVSIEAFRARRTRDDGSVARTFRHPAAFIDSISQILEPRVAAIKTKRQRRQEHCEQRVVPMASG